MGLGEVATEGFCLRFLQMFTECFFSDSFCSHTISLIDKAVEDLIPRPILKPISISMPGNLLDVTHVGLKNGAVVDE